MGPDHVLSLRQFHSQDLLLDEMSRRTDLIVVSVDYRLAPEHPYPAPRVDCCIVVDWLFANCRERVCSERMNPGEPAVLIIAVEV